MKIGIIFGGNSKEHEISIITAYAVKRKLINFYDVKMIYIDFNQNVYDASKLSLNDFKNKKYKKLKKTMLVQHGIKSTSLDCAVLAVHGENCEDGIISALCRFYNIPFVGCDILASSISLDKFATYQYLKNDLPLIETKRYTRHDFIIGNVVDYFPCILKPTYGGSSIGINICSSKDEFFIKAKESLKECDEIIIQPFYKDILEYNMAFYENGNSKLEKIDKKSEYFSFDDKYNESFKMIHQKLVLDDEEKIITLGRRVYELLRCKGIIRIDFFKIKDEIYINEINTIPGSLGMYLFDNFSNILMEEIELEMKRKNNVYCMNGYLQIKSFNK